jgi:hypothetical protein
MEEIIILIYTRLTKKAFAPPKRLSKAGYLAVTELKISKQQINYMRRWWICLRTSAEHVNETGASCSNALSPNLPGGKA